MKKEVFFSEDQLNKINEIVSDFSSRSNFGELLTTRDLLELLASEVSNDQKKTFDFYKSICVRNYNQLHKIISEDKLSMKDIDENFDYIEWDHVYHPAGFMISDIALFTTTAMERIRNINNLIEKIHSIPSDIFSNISGYHIIHQKPKAFRGKSISIIISEYVYTFKTLDLIKIGRTNDVNRISSHKSSNPFMKDIRMYRVFRHLNIEELLHENYKERKSKLEFFDLDSDDVEKYIYDNFYVLDKINIK